MRFLNIPFIYLTLAVWLPTTLGDSCDTIDVAFYTDPGCNTGYIEMHTTTLGECYGLTNDAWFASYLVPSVIPADLLNNGYMLESGDTNPVDCDVGRCVYLTETLGCQPALNTTGTTNWFGML